MAKTHKKTKKGITGIEAAIVMIAFVVVAAALAFVVLNMGMFTTQRARQVIAQGLQQASSSIIVDGSVTGLVNSSGKTLTLIAIPIRLAGQQPVDLATSKSTISVILGDHAYDNWYKGVFTNESITSGNTTYSFDPNDLNSIYTALNSAGKSDGVYVFFVPSTLRNNNTVLEPGEKAIVVVFFHSTNGPAPYDTIRIEVRPPIGAPLTVDRTVPATLPAGGAITLG